MDLASLQELRTIKGIDHLVVNPGLNFTLYIPVPIPAIAPHALKTLERYLAFIPTGPSAGFRDQKANTAP